jgi:hypothetical protein
MGVYGGNLKRKMIKSNMQMNLIVESGENSFSLDDNGRSGDKKEM